VGNAVQPSFRDPSRRTARRFTRRLAAIGVGLAVVATVNVLPRPAAGAVAKPVNGSFVGKLAGTNVLIAVVADPLQAGTVARSVRVYFCDDKQTFEWFVGDVKGNAVSLTSTAKDATVKLTLHAASVTGRVTLPRLGSRTVKAVAAKGVAGLYTGQVTQDGAVAGRSATGARIEGKVTGPSTVSGNLIPVTGQPVPFTFAAIDPVPVSFRLIVHPSGEVRGARAELSPTHGFQLWEPSK
jgi:hypothetical protein